MAVLKDLVLRIVIDLRRRSPRTPGAPSVNPRMHHFTSIILFVSTRLPVLSR
jgi:hypothetical protein